MKRNIKIIVSLLCVIIVSFSMTGAPFFEYNAIQAASKTKLKKSKVTLKEGATYQVKLKNKSKKGRYHYQTSNKKIAKVNKKGKVTAIKKGNAKITVKHAVGRKITKIGTLKVTVKAKDAKKANIPTNSPTTEDKEPHVPVVPTNQDVNKQQTPRDLGKVYFKGDKFEVTLQVDSKWDDAYNATVTIRNIGDAVIDDWALVFYTEDELTNVWNGKILDYNEGVYLIDNWIWNQDIEVGKSVSFGFTAKYDKYIDLPKSYSMSHHRSIVNPEDYKVDFKLHSDWGDGYSVGMNISNLTNEVIEDWSLEFDFDKEIDDIWSAVIIKKEGNHYELKNPGWEQNVETNRPVVFRFNGHPGGVTEEPGNYVLTKFSNEIDYNLDSDEDGLSNVMEVIIGSHPYLSDSDGDGLDDYLEYTYLGLDPLNPDTDGDGVKDGDEDIDGDGLTNLQELKFGTDCLITDTDEDGLLDGEEVNRYGTDPMNEDTDDDGLNDGDEILLGFNPLKPDTNDNGILDCDEKVPQSIKAEIQEDEKPEITAVTVNMNVNGNIQNNTEIESVYNEDIMSSEVEGLVGAPVEIFTEGEFDQATITFHFDPSKLGTTEIEDLAIMWYDEENNDYVIFDEESVIDKNLNTISYTTTHFSTYMVVNKKTWYKTWRNSIDYRKKPGNTYNYDTVLTLDVSGSMKGQDIKDAKEAAIQFIDAMYNRDNACIITYNDSADVLKNFTNDRDTLKELINGIQVGGETDANAGLVKAIKQFTKSGYKSDNNKMIILLCDGDVDYVEETVSLAQKNKIAIYTILIGDSKPNRNLEKIAKETGGQYYVAENAGDVIAHMYKVSKNTLGELDDTDMDKDGLYDVFETCGMLCPNGKTIYSDSTKKDTDNDDLNDSYEMGVDRSLKKGKPYKTKKIKIKASGEEIYAYYFDYRSDPNKVDTDRDGLSDRVDPKPRKKFSKKFKFDSSINTIPTSNSMNSKIYEAEKKRNESKTIKRPLEEMIKLTDISNRAYLQVLATKSMSSGQLLNHFLNNSGTDAIVTSQMVHNLIARNNIIKTPAKKNFRNNLKLLLRACKDMVKDGETRIVRTSPEFNFSFANYKELGFTTLLYLNEFSSFGAADAGMVAKCTNKDGEYTVVLKYYLIDYYQWEHTNNGKIGLVSPAELYKLNEAGMAHNFKVYGYKEYTFEFDKNSKVKDISKKLLK